MSRRVKNTKCNSNHEFGTASMRKSRLPGIPKRLRKNDIVAEKKKSMFEKWRRP